MTNRTASLLLLFTGALVAAAVLLALLVGTLRERLIMAPWMAASVVVGSEAIVLYFGRHHILPPAVARKSARAALSIVSMVMLTLIAAVAAVWTLRWASGLTAGLSTLTLAAWFALLWCAVQRQQKWHARCETGVR